MRIDFLNLLVDCPVVDPGVGLEVFTKLMELLNHRIFLLLGVVFLKVFLLFQRELDVDELVDVLVVHELGLQELDPRDPVVAVILRLAPELDVPYVLVQDALSDILRHCYFEVEGAGLHQSFKHLEDVLDLDQAKRLLACFPLLGVVVPHEVSRCKNEQPLRYLFICFLALLEHKALIQRHVLCAVNEDVLHLFHDNAVLLLEGQLFFGLDVLAHQDVVAELVDFDLDLLLRHY